MNKAYERYLNDEKFRAALMATARRERARAMAEFFPKLFTFTFFRRSRSPRDTTALTCHS